MAYLYYTILAVVLYLVSDWILNRIEEKRGQRFEYRSLVFFVIILVLSVGTFRLMETLMTPAAAPGPGMMQQHAPAAGN